MQSMNKNLGSVLTSFSESLNKLCRQMFKKSKNDEDEDPNIVFLNKFVIDLLVELTKKVNQVNKKIAS